MTQLWGKSVRGNVPVFPFESTRIPHVPTVAAGQFPRQRELLEMANCSPGKPPGSFSYRSTGTKRTIPASMYWPPVVCRQ